MGFGRLAIRKVVCFTGPGRERAEYLEADVTCGRSSKALHIPTVNCFTEKAQVVACLERMGWRHTQRYGWLSSYYARRTAEEQRRRRNRRRRRLA